LAWANRLISPDWVGAMREKVQGGTNGAPCVFLQGASGELGPREGFTADTSVPDRHGRRLGLAVLATLEGMLPPGHELALDAIVESGAPLAVWGPRPRDVPTELDAELRRVAVPPKGDLPDLASVQAGLA